LAGLIAGKRHSSASAYNKPASLVLDTENGEANTDHVKNGKKQFLVSCPASKRQFSISQYHCCTLDLVALAILGATVTITGCTSLKPLADFGKNAAAVAGYQEVAKDYPHGLERQRLYGQTGSAVSDENVAKRRKDAQRLLEAQNVLQAYAQALGALASDDLISYDKEVDALSKSLVNGKFATSAQTESYANAVKLGFRFFTDLYRRAKIKQIITTYNPKVQAATTQLVEIVAGGYLTGLSGEESMFAQLVAGRARKSAEDKGLEGLPQFLNVLADEHEQVLKDKEANARALVGGIRQFGQGHQELADSIGKMDFKETVEIARKYADELRKVIKSFNS
jgi:hypothetical protein